MALVFYLSAQPAEQSNNLSTDVTEIIVETVEKVVPSVDFDLESFNHLLRKNAHFFAYLVLGILILNAVRRSGVLGFRGIILTLFISVLFAVSDEIHQLFVPGRGGQVKDVLIDSAGAFIGILMYLLGVYIRSRAKHR